MIDANQNGRRQVDSRFVADGAGPKPDQAFCLAAQTFDLECACLRAPQHGVSVKVRQIIAVVIQDAKFAVHGRYPQERECQCIADCTPANDIGSRQRAAIKGTLRRQGDIAAGRSNSGRSVPAKAHIPAGAASRF